MAELFARALPASEYAKINDFSLAKEQNVSEAVKTLYVAGIMINKMNKTLNTCGLKYKVKG